MRRLSLLICLFGLISSSPCHPAVSARATTATYPTRSSSSLLLKPRRAAARPAWAKDRIARAAVRIHTVEPMTILGRPMGRGNGVLTAKGVLTCWHVVESAEIVYVISEDGAMRRAASWSRVGSDGDLALVVGESLGGSEASAATVEDERPVGPQQAEVFGFWGVGHEVGTPFRIQAFLFPGAQIPESVSDRGGKWLPGAFPLMHGMSGSGVYVDGRLVGLCSMTPADGHGLGHVYVIDATGL